MKTCGKNKKLHPARIYYRYTLAIFWLFFLRVGFVISVFLIVAKHAIMLRTKSLVSSVNLKGFFMILLISLMIGVSLPVCVYAKSSNMPLLADQARILFTQGNVMIKAQEATKWTEATSGMILVKGDILKIGPNSWAQLDINTHKNYCTVGENTSVNLVDLSPVKSIRQ